MRSFFQKFNKIAASKELAVWLIASIAGVGIIGNIIPQDGAMPPGADVGASVSSTGAIVNILKLNDIYSSYLFLGIIILLFVNLSFCMAKRLKLVFDDTRAAARIFSVAGLPLIGSLLFHVSMMVIMVAGVYDISSRMRGGMVITRGQQVQESHESYIYVDEAPFFLENHSFFNITLKDVHMKIEEGYVLDTVAVLNITDGDFSKDYDVRINHPAQYKNTMFVMQLYGFSPLVRMTGPDGGQIMNVFLNLATPDKGDVVEDSFQLPGTDLELSIKLYPNAEEKDGKIANYSSELKNPLFVIQLDKKIEDGKIKQQLYKGIMKPGETAVFEGYELNIGDDIRYWFQFDVTKEPGKKIIYAGFWLGLAGISLRLFPIFLRPIKDDEEAEDIEKEKVV